MSRPRRLVLEPLEARRLLTALVHLVDIPDAAGTELVWTPAPEADASPGSTAHEPTTWFPNAEAESEQGLVQYHLRLTDPAGRELTQVSVGDAIVLEIWVSDLRDFASGVFAAFGDLTFQGLAVTWNDVSYPYSHVTSQRPTAADDGIRHIGGILTTSTTTAERQVVARVSLVAVEEGTAEITIRQSHGMIYETLVHGWNEGVPHAAVLSDSIEIRVEGPSANPQGSTILPRPDSANWFVVEIQPAPSVSDDWTWDSLWPDDESSGVEDEFLRWPDNEIPMDIDSLLWWGPRPVTDFGEPLFLMMIKVPPSATSGSIEPTALMLDQLAAPPVMRGWQMGRVTDDVGFPVVRTHDPDSAAALRQSPVAMPQPTDGQFTVNRELADPAEAPADELDAEVDAEAAQAEERDAGTDE